MLIMMCLIEPGGALQPLALPGRTRGTAVGSARLLGYGGGGGGDSCSGGGGGPRNCGEKAATPYGPPPPAAPRPLRADSDK